MTKSNLSDLEKDISKETGIPVAQVDQTIQEMSKATGESAETIAKGVDEGMHAAEDRGEDVNLAAAIGNDDDDEDAADLGEGDGEDF